MTICKYLSNRKDSFCRYIGKNVVNVVDIVLVSLGIVFQPIFWFVVVYYSLTTVLFTIFLIKGKFDNFMPNLTRDDIDEEYTFNICLLILFAFYGWWFLLIIVRMILIGIFSYKRFKLGGSK